MRRRGEVDRAEWGWVAAWIAVALLVTSVPTLIGVAQSTPNRVFSGFTYTVEDINTYLAKMRQGAQGEWLFRIAHTSELHDGALLLTYHLLMGKVA
ncbi:MAG TPA: hypothetical protein VJ754_09935, partial [Anaerolineae bacterium]|nr:hypothetical protein [Anaerolineae bacterium]